MRMCMRTQMCGCQYRPERVADTLELVSLLTQVTRNELGYFERTKSTLNC